ncbi:Sporulation-specific protein [Wickerhamomyces ciferrii]|uniref:Sporulation-specific protein n=1 Tax=Wickerhamomyces ciferrii (strain ATCC 14091 / BCRC 22168 / CBS 111 / JCM 3599 / NBRC 0793 / NRRL Y-1031 F-60-10) TaxID=1206466 RepID=K0KRR2_WICCF|nr:Sporulation-specific protein [Wickerhamomyces ciferrii]CCH45791.1 Sporulation-specific protein [Wickerhamomyces ciferrii]
MKTEDITTSSASAASAASSYSVASGCTLSSATASSQSDLDKYSDCEALKGDLTITGDLSSGSLDKVKAIYGSLIINNATNLGSFSAGQLTTITDSLELTILTVLDQLSLPQLSTVGTVHFVTLPALNEIQLNTGITKINSLYISDTSLENLNGFDVQSLDTFNVNNNKNLNSIDSQLQNVKVALEVSYNSNDVEVSFDDLEWANNITFRDISSISLSKLENVNASLGFINTSVDSIDLSNVQKIGGSLTFVSNDELEEIDLSNLTSIGGGFDISNNTHLKDIEGFDSLESVGGSIIFVGNFTNASLPSLKRVSGGLELESSEEFDCEEFNKQKNAIQGDSYVCKAASSSTSIQLSSTSGSSSETGSGSSSSASGSGSSSSSSKGDANGMVVFQATSVFGAIGALVLALL